MAKRRIGLDNTQGLRMPHYTNGRLLTAEDLTDDQQSVRERMGLYGKAHTAGIIEGLNVSPTGNRKALIVTGGLGINANGDLVRLARDSVTLPVEPIVPEANGVRLSPNFKVCDDPDDSGTSSPIMSGAYLLTAAPTAELQGHAPRRSPAGVDTAVCANQWEVEGITFSIIRIDPYKAPTGKYSQRNRNLLAHWFYGSQAIDGLMLNIFNFDQNYTGYADLPPDEFTDCDLPLAAFFWRERVVGQSRISQIDFVDEWACRRRVAQPHPATAWRANISDERKAEGEARFQQFQEHIAQIQQDAGTNTGTLQATRHFAHLPPVGFLPVNPFELVLDDVFDKVFETALRDRDRVLIEAGELARADILERVRTVLQAEFRNNRVFSIENFFKGILPSVYYGVHEDEIHDRLHQSWVQKPINLPAPPDIEVNIFDFALAGLFENATHGVYSPILDNLSRVRSNSNRLFETLGSDAVLNTIREREAAPLERNIEEERAANVGFGLNINRAAIAVDSLNLLNNYTYFAAREIPFYRYFDDYWFAPEEQEEEPEPIIDILVDDELLQPYRNYLRNQMVNRIRNAIDDLVNRVTDVFVGTNNYLKIINAVNEDFITRSVLSKAINTGIASRLDLANIESRFKTPAFYVTFVRYRSQYDKVPGREYQMPAALRD